MRKFLLPVLLFSISLLSFKAPHKFYTSITKIEYNNKSQSYEIIMNVFSDDWEKALSEIHQRKVTIDQAETQFSLEGNQSISVFVNGKEILVEPNSLVTV